MGNAVSFNKGAGGMRNIKIFAVFVNIKYPPNVKFHRLLVFEFKIRGKERILLYFKKVERPCGLPEVTAKRRREPSPGET
jgi:hypothetical protein